MVFTRVESGFENRKAPSTGVESAFKRPEMVFTRVKHTFRRSQAFSTAVEGAFPRSKGERRPPARAFIACYR